MPIKIGAAFAALALIVCSSAPAVAEPDSLRRMSEAPDGSQSNGLSLGVSVSNDGPVAFASEASNLVAGDDNDMWDVFLYREKGDEAVLVSRAASGGISNGSSSGADISADGGHVAFVSSASDLVEGDDNKATDVFVRDLSTDKNEVVSVTGTGAPANGHSSSARLSSNGRFVAFDSRATNLSRFPDRNKRTDVFVHDRQKGTTNRVSVSSKGREANDHSFVAGVSNDGTRVAFVSFADNLVPRDTNEFGDTFVYDRESKKTKRASVSSSERQSSQGGIATDLSPNGRYVVFYAGADDLVRGDTNKSSDVFVRDLRKGTTERVSLGSGGVQANNYSHNEAQISANACLVTFDSGASNLVEGDTNNANDIFVRNRCNATTTRLSVTPDGTEANADSSQPRISADGSRVGFVTEATNLGGPDTNEVEDVFLATR